MRRLKKTVAILMAVVMAITLMPSQAAIGATKVSMSKCSITLSKTSYNYTGSVCKPTVTVKYSGKNLRNGTDYSVKYTNNINPGTATVTVTGKNKYTGSVKKTFKINNALSVALSKKTYTYSGKANKPDVTVKKGTTKLASKYYSVTYKNNINAGTAAVIVKGKGKYLGQNAYVKFRTNPKILIDENVHMPQLRYSYTGKPHEPPVTVEDGGVSLIEGKDYTVRYSENVNVGAASAVVSGKGNYTGTINRYFDIEPALEVDLSKDRYTFSGEECKPEVTAVKRGEIILTADDYTVSYRDNVKPGTASVIVEGKGEYEGLQGTATFEIIEVFPNANPMYMELKALEQRNIVIGDNPNNFPVKFESLNPNIATVDANGLVTAGEITGETRIKVTVGPYNLQCVVVVAGKENPENPNQPGNDPSHDPNKITVVENHVSYKTAEKKTGSFTSGAMPDNILSGFDNTQGRSGMNHPNGIATDGEHFVVCDTWNNRVLIYNCLPMGGEQPDVVLGQPDFENFDAGNGESQMNWPVAAAFAKGKLFITDTNNYRVLVYDGIPKTNGAKPDRIISMISENLSTSWPWAIWSDGEKLALTCTLGGRVAIWNDAEAAAEGKFADIVLNGMGTPRTIVSDGKYLLIGDHNVNKQPKFGCYVWRSFPTSDSSKYDFICDMQYGGTIIDGDLYLRENGSFNVFEGLIDSENEQPVESFSPRDGCLGGDYNSILYVNGRTYVASYNSSYIAIYNGKISEEKISTPDGLLGASQYVLSMSVERGIYQNPVMASDGTSLVVSDDFNRMLAVYKNIPDDNNVRADYEYMFESADEYPVDVDIDERGKMYVLTPFSVLVWNRVPVKGEMFDMRYEIGSESGIGTLNAKLTVDGENVYIASETDRKIYVFDRDASSFKLSDAKRYLEYGPVRDIFSNGEYLVISNQNENKVDIYRTADLTLYGTVKSESMNVQQFRIANPASAIILPDGQLVIANTGNNVINIYDSVDAAIKDYRDYKVSLGDNEAYRVENYGGGAVPLKEITGIAAKGTMFSPTTLSYKDGHLWAGEFKFSSRMFRYDLR